nr:MAG: RNA dependent RNA polymerase [Leviviridae sp.]
MEPQPFSVLASSRLKPAGGTEACVPQPVTTPRRDAKGLINDEDVAVRVDPVLAFNELVAGLFLGMPPWCMEHLHEAAEISGKYQEVADILKGSTDVDGYFRFAQAASFLKKYEGMPEEQQKEAEDVTLERWLATEAINRKNNGIFWDLANRPLTHADDERLLLVNAVREEISTLIGEFPPDFSEVSKFGRFGPGTSLSHKEGELDPLLKCINPTALVSQKPEVLWLMNMTLMGEAVFTSRTGIERYKNSSIPRAIRIAVALEGVDWVEHERYATVPKNVERLRSIGVGASLATWIQQAYDGWLRVRLTGWGLDLSNQDPNRSLAYLGSLQSSGEDRPCTIDLTDASSRICCGLVASVFSKPWARTLFRQRASSCLLPDGSLERLEMFSAMGNALTFSLQSLIFAAVVRVVLRTQARGSQKWRVYGDDIIVPRSCFDVVCRSLELLGFEPNMKKSFKEGYFRESCGADYLHGTDVRPLFFKTPVTDVSEAFKMLNLVALYAAEAPIPAWSYRRVWKYFLSTVPVDFRVFGEPSEVLDGYIWAPVAGVRPNFIIGRVVVTEAPPEKWAYLRTLLVRQSGDSHVRKSKRGEALYDLDRYYPPVQVSGNRLGIKLPGRKWRWLKVLSMNTRRLKGLQSKLIQLFI